MKQPTYTTKPFSFVESHTPRPMAVKEATLPLSEMPINRLQTTGLMGLSTTEILALIIGGPNGLQTAYRLLEKVSIADLPRTTLNKLRKIEGIGQITAARIMAAIHLGFLVRQTTLTEKPRITSPADGANLLMSEMAFLKQEHLRVILLNTRNQVIGTPTIYIGSLNTSVVRVGEIFKPAIDADAAAIIVAHNHPSGDPSPSPEDISVTRAIVEAGKLLSIDVLDHLIIGHNRFTSLKERGLGFS